MHAFGVAIFIDFALAEDGTPAAKTAFCSGEYISKGLQTVEYRKCMTATLTEQTRGIYQLKLVSLRTKKIDKKNPSHEGRD